MTELRTLRQETIQDYQGGPTVIPRVLKKGREEGQSQRERERESERARGHCHMAGFKDGGCGLKLKNVGVSRS